MKAIIGFDLDGTLFDDFQIIKQSFKEVSKYLTFDRPEIVYNKLLDYYMKDNKFVFNRLLTEYKVYDLRIIDECKKVYRNINIEKLELFDWVVSVLELLKEMNSKIGIITNGNKEYQLKKILALNLFKYFDESNIFINSSKKYYKPKTISYRKLYDSNDCLKYYIGNNCNIDFKGANRLKIKTICIKDKMITCKNKRTKDFCPNIVLLGHELKNFLREEIKYECINNW